MVSAGAAFDFFALNIVIVCIVAAFGTHRFAIAFAFRIGRRRGLGPAAALGRRMILVLFGDFAQQCFAVSDGNLIVIRMDFVEGQEAVTVAAIFDERRLQAGFDARYLGKIDITAKLFAVLAFEIEFFNASSIYDHNPGFFRVGRVYKHFLCH
jgi:hypothetical protein